MGRGEKGVSEESSVLMSEDNVLNKQPQQWTLVKAITFDLVSWRSLMLLFLKISMLKETLGDLEQQEAERGFQMAILTSSKHAAGLVICRLAVWAPVSTIPSIFNLFSEHLFQVLVLTIPGYY